MPGPRKPSKPSKNDKHDKNDRNVVQIDIQSSFDMVDLIHVVFESLSGQVGFNSDDSHWMSVAIRESVTNAVRHGNKMDPDKRVTVRFEIQHDEFAVVVSDEGEGFDPEDIPDPLAQGLRREPCQGRRALADLARRLSSCGSG